MSWTEDRVEVLKKRWAEGHSASQIAKELGGVTRNAVIGKLHRLGLSGNRVSTKPKKHRESALLSLGHSSFLMDQTNRPHMRPINSWKTCQMPIENHQTGGFSLCGEPSLNKNVSYCAECCKTIYKTPVHNHRRNMVLPMVA